MAITDAERAEARQRGKKFDVTAEEPDSPGPDLVLEEHAFTYEWMGKIYGINVVDVMLGLGITPESMKAREGTEAQLADEIRTAAGMPEDLPADHVLKVFQAAVKKTSDLGKDMQPA